MNIEVSKDNVVILNKTESPHENEYNITECNFTFDEFTDSFQVKRAIFTILSTGEMYEIDIINGKCFTPSEVLKHEYETIKLGVYGYNIEIVDEKEVLKERFSPSYDTFVVPTGSYEEGALSPDIITPSQYDIYSQALQEGLDAVAEALEEVSHVDIDAEQLEHGASVTITNRNNEEKTVVINDGERGETGPQGDPGRDATINGVNTLNIIEGTNISLEQTGSNLKISNTYSYDDTEVKTDISNLKTNKADKSEIPTKTSQLQNDSGFVTNAVNDLINYYLKSETYSKSEVNDLISAITTLDLRVVETLPTEDISTTTIYLVPKSSAGTNDAYDEYIYVSNNWEFIGSTQVDLTDYVKNTDYATTNEAGVIKPSNYLQVAGDGTVYCAGLAYNVYQLVSGYTFISKGTLENVIEGKGLVSNTDYASDSVGGVVRDGPLSLGYGITQTGANAGKLNARILTYTQYQNNLYTNGFVGKGTLENVIEGKGLTTKAYVDGLVGDVSSVIDAINGEVV